MRRSRLAGSFAELLCRWLDRHAIGGSPLLLILEIRGVLSERSLVAKLKIEFDGIGDAEPVSVHQVEEDRLPANGAVPLHEVRKFEPCDRPVLVSENDPCLGRVSHVTPCRTCSVWP